MDSEVESDCSGYIKFGNRTHSQLYKSLLQNMIALNDETQEVESNLFHIVQNSGKLAKDIEMLMKALPNCKVTVSMGSTSDSTMMDTTADSTM